MADVLTVMLLSVRKPEVPLGHAGHSVRPPPILPQFARWNSIA